MPTLKSLLSDPRLNTPEFGARLYPEKARRLAAHTLNLALKKDADLPEQVVTAAQREVRQLITDLSAGLRRPEGRPGTNADTGLMALVKDVRLVQQAFYQAIWSGHAPETARRYWGLARTGIRPLEPSERRTLRVELQALVAACERALK